MEEPTSQGPTALMTAVPVTSMQGTTAPVTTAAPDTTAAPVTTATEGTTELQVTTQEITTESDVLDNETVPDSEDTTGSIIINNTEVNIVFEESNASTQEVATTQDSNEGTYLYGLVCASVYSLLVNFCRQYCTRNRGQ